jgi:hypothetical protein
MSKRSYLGLHLKQEVLLLVIMLEKNNLEYYFTKEKEMN